jgi:putative ABC transport system permease protein
MKIIEMEDSVRDIKRALRVLLHSPAFTERDDAGALGVVIINEAMARMVWPKGDLLNHRLLIGRRMRPEYDRDAARQVVGIVGDIRDKRLDATPRPAMYVPIAQLPDGINAFNLRLLPVAWVVRTTVEPHSLSSAIQEQLRKGTGQPVARVRSMDEVAAQSTARARFNTLLMTIFGCSALLLAAVGIYGLIAYSVQQRTREIGIRRAFGAEANDVRNMVIFEGARLALIGVVIGIAVFFGVTRLIASFLFGVKPWDPVVFVGVPLVLSAIALVAVWLPARRATRIDPIVALRYESLQRRHDRPSRDYLDTIVWFKDFWTQQSLADPRLGTCRNRQTVLLLRCLVCAFEWMYNSSGLPDQPLSTRRIRTKRE